MLSSVEVPASEVQEVFVHAEVPRRGLTLVRLWREVGLVAWSCRSFEVRCMASVEGLSNPHDVQMRLEKVA